MSINSVRIVVSTDPPWTVLLARELAKMERAASRTMRGSARDLKARWRSQIEGAGLGTKLARSIRGEGYPKGEPSLRSAAVIWSKARDEIIAPHETGAVIRAKRRMFLAVPIFGAVKMKGDRGRKITPGEYERRTGAELQIVPRPGRPALLVDTGRQSAVKGMRAGRQGPAAPRARRRKSAKTWKPVFVLLPQVRLKKRLDLRGASRDVARSVPSRFAAEFRGRR